MFYAHTNAITEAIKGPRQAISKTFMPANQYFNSFHFFYEPIVLKMKMKMKMKILVQGSIGDLQINRTIYCSIIYFSAKLSILFNNIRSWKLITI